MTYFCKFIDPYTRTDAASARTNTKQSQQSLSFIGHALSIKKITGGINGGIINDSTLRSLDYRRDYLFPFSLLLHNTRPVGRQVKSFVPLLHSANQ